MVMEADSLLSASITRVWLLEWEWSTNKQMLDGVEQCTDRMARSSGAKIICGDVQINLGAGDQPMTKKIADRHQANPGAHQVGCECVPHAMRRERKAYATALAPCAYAFVDAAA